MANTKTTDLEGSLKVRSARPGTFSALATRWPKRIQTDCVRLAAHSRLHRQYASRER
jgi:hypothetical protein